jgi:surface antigen
VITANLTKDKLVSQGLLGRGKTISQALADTSAAEAFRVNPAFKTIKDQFEAGTLRGDEGFNVALAKGRLTESGITDFNATPQELSDVLAMSKMGIGVDLQPELLDFISKQGKLPQQTFGTAETGRTFDPGTSEIFDPSGKLVHSPSAREVERKQEIKQRNELKIASAGAGPTQGNTTGWVDPATGKETRQGVGEPVGEYRTREGVPQPDREDVSGPAPTAGQLLRPSQLTGLKETDLARTTGINIYRRDLAKEQSAIGLYSKNYGEPKTDEQWRQFHDYVYEDKVPGGGINKYVEKPGDNIDVGNVETGKNGGSPSTSLDFSDSTQVTAGNIDQMANGILSSLNKQIYALQNQLQEQAAKNLATAETTKNKAVKGYRDVTIDGKTNEKRLAELLEEYKITEKSDKITSIMVEMEREKEALNLGLLQEGDRVAPIGYIGRSQARLENQAAARIGALSAIADAYEGDYDRAWAVAGTFLNAFQADTKQKIESYEYLIGLADADIVKLDKEEKDAIDNKIALLKEAEVKQLDNAQKLTTLMLQYPEAAQKAKIGLTDDYDQAVQKMMPFISQSGSDIKNIGTSASPRYVEKQSDGSWTDIVVAPGEYTAPASGTYGGQCGSWARTQYSSIADGQAMGDSYESKQGWVDSYGTVGVEGLQVGDLVITNGADVSKSGNPLPYGHAFIVGAVDENGKITAYESNAKGNELVTNSRQVDLSSPAIYGYVRGQLNLPETAPASTGDEEKFYDEIRDAQNDLKSGLSWGQVWNTLYTEYSTGDVEQDKALGELIDRLLDKDIWSKEGAYQEFKNSTTSNQPIIIQ